MLILGYQHRFCSVPCSMVCFDNNSQAGDQSVVLSLRLSEVSLLHVVNCFFGSFTLLIQLSTPPDMYRYTQSYNNKRSYCTHYDNSTN